MPRLNEAKKNKKDEFYTQLEDIEREMRFYVKHFKNKTILCNCDDPRISNFFHYFSYSFEDLKLKKLITTCYKSQERDLFSKNKSEKSIYLEYNGDKNNNKIPDVEEIGIQYFKGDGDFRSEEAIELLKKSDMITIHVPKQKKPLIEKKELKLMKEEAFIVNSSRGGVINEKDLIDALNNREIKCAGLDVYENEPKPNMSVLMNEHISLSPHIGAATIEAQERIGSELAEQINKILNG